MAAKGQGRTGFFKGASRPPRKRQASHLQGTLPAILYAWDMVSDALTWGPGAAEALGLPSRDLPKTGKAFAQMIEPGCGLSRQEAICAT